MFNTSQGTSDPMVATDTLNRVGDEINLKGLSLRFLLEQQVYLSDVTYRCMIIKSAKGDTPTLGTLFMGLSTCKVLDHINTERYSVVYSKTLKITARNMVPGNNTSGTAFMVQGASGPTTGTQTNGTTDILNASSRPTRVVKIWIPGSKLFKNGVIRYENNSAQTKFFDYHFIMYAYINSDADSNNSGNVIAALMKHYICQIYYKDA